MSFGGGHPLRPRGASLRLPLSFSQLPLRYPPSMSQMTVSGYNEAVVTEEVEDAAWNIFSTIDANSDGEISKSEMVRALRKDPILWDKFKIKLWNELKLKTFNSGMEFLKYADINGDGTVNADVVSFEKFSTEFVKNADTDGDGTVSLEEFRTFLSQIDAGGDLAEFSPEENESQAPPQSILEDEDSLFELLFMFENIDEDNDGQVTTQELKTATRKSKHFKHSMQLRSFRDVTRLVENADTDGDGQLSFDEFKSFLVTSYSQGFLEYLDSARDEQFLPREKHASVVVFREVDDQLQVLVRMQSSHADKRRGLSILGGKRQENDANSRVTALREVAESTGLADIIGLDGSPESLLRSVQLSNISLPPSPKSFFMFDKGELRDWWVLKLGGPGVFVKGQDNDLKGLEDINPMLSSLPEGAEIADCFGHVWIPVKSLKTMSDSIPKIGGCAFDLKVFKAAVALRRNKQRLNDKASIWRQLDFIIAA